MDLTTAPVLIGGYVTGKERKNRLKDENGNDVGATHYERVSFIDQASGRASEIELHPTVNGDRPAVGTKASLIVRAFPQSVTKRRQDGTTYPSRAYDLTCVGFGGKAA